MSRKKKSKVVLFEDDPETGTRIEAAVRRELPTTAAVVRFQPAAPKEKDIGRTYEDRLREELGKKAYAGASLIVCDRDLSQTERYIGLSEAVVSNVATELGLPICLYARGLSGDLLERKRSWGDGRIVLDSKSIDEMATKVAVLVQGFAEVADGARKVLAAKGKARPRTPAAVMAGVLGRPDLADQIALYGLGDQKMVAQILPDYEKRKSHARLKERLPALFGYWLYDSILRFPGLLVDRVAAASHLNIGVNVFGRDSKVQDLFKSSLYRGPFRDPADPHWWRGQLDDLVLAAGCTDGRSFAQKKLGRKIPFCRCSLDTKKSAGYYCVATKTAVSRDNSYGNISWFPQGADLARIRKDVYEEIGPWLGLF